ncbi:5'-methylthioadenosine/S-adenosylhomocysteine nucleosidase [Xylanibacillus composti]|uniref:adenosylhomocysteine nucleosidase n=1 Tax=Xylanibacillus composti TaxID=1572762 RepID=A0A8J4M199_9BACL|nr:5'-methylthioadenosine/S-adenosylhomocysteine nucleosidase [Xylanibacillus composti]
MNGNVGIIGAMKEEIELLRQAMQLDRVIEHAGITFLQGKLHDRDVIVCQSGVGKVNAAVCTQLLIDRFHVQAILFTGVAGALDPSMDIGDIVISRDCMQHDMDASPLGFAKGEIPYAPRSVFAADARLIEIAEQVGQARFPGRMRVGRVLSGDQFIADRAVVEKLHRDMGGSCTEMEGAAVAQVCDMNDIPFLIIRSMSDKADGSADVNFAEFTVEASRRSFNMIDGIVQAL